MAAESIEQQKTWLGDRLDFHFEDFEANGAGAFVMATQLQTKLFH
ncbi:MAG: hypothetical protein U5J83_03935 [Bryobacterales bacterium]|nr:hypothetical protein [Bryobacterales bacterium]